MTRRDFCELRPLKVGRGELDELRRRSRAQRRRPLSLERAALADDRPRADFADNLAVYLGGEHAVEDEHQRVVVVGALLEDRLSLADALRLRLAAAAHQ